MHYRRPIKVNYKVIVSPRLVLQVEGARNERQLVVQDIARYLEFVRILLRTDAVGRAEYLKASSIRFIKNGEIDGSIAEDVLQEIGRASCRERVCKYV